MHKYIILFFLVLTLLCSCGGDNPPEGILKKEEMINVLTDIHLVDGGMVMYAQTPDTLYKYGTARYLDVFKKDHTDSTQFRKSFKYYTLKPATLNDMYVKILKRLQQKTDSLTKLLTIQNKIKKPQSTSTGGRVPVSAIHASVVPVGQPTPVRPGMMMNPGQPEVIRFHSKRDSAIREQLKKQNALSKK